MDILNVMQCAHLGGMEQASLRLMCGLMQRGHHCRVLSLNPLGALQEQLAEHGIPAVGLPYEGRMGWKSAPRLFRHLRNEKADAVLMTGHNLLAMLAMGALGQRRRLLAMHFHHSVRPDWQWRLFYRLALSRFNAISFPSDFVRLEAETIFPAVRPIAYTVRNPLFPPAEQTPLRKAQSRYRLNLPQNGILIGNAGWLIPRKRFDIFLRSGALRCRDDDTVRLVIAGDGPQRAELEALAAGLGIADRVIWLGWQQNMTDFYHAMDVVLFNSDWDAMGNTPLEAMAHGVPVAASVLNGGLKEIIHAPEVGFLIGWHDERLLADAIAGLSGNRAIAQNGRARVTGLSDPGLIAEEVERLLLQGQPALRETPSHPMAVRYGGVE